MIHYFFQRVYVLMFCIPLFICVTGTARAGGPIHGAKAAGMGTAFIGVADDPSSILHNPGGLTQSKGTQVYGGVTALTIDSSYENPAGDNEYTKRQYFFPPHLFVTSDMGTDSLVLGIGFHSPFGIGGRKWDREGLTRYQSTEENIATFTINPTVAWEFHPGISIAAAVDYMYATMEAEKMIDQSAFGYGDGKSHFEADGDGWGYNLGLLAEIGDSLRLGFSYRSSINVDYSGEIKTEDIAPALQPVFGGSPFKTDIETSSTFPEIIGAGISYSTNKLTAAVDIELVRWSSFDSERVDLKEEVAAAGVTDSTTVFDWKDSWQYKFGLEYRASDSFALRAGYAYISHFVPDHTLEPGNPDADQHNFSIGGGYVMKNWVADAFFNAGFSKKRKVSNDILSGTYETFMPCAGMSIGYTF